MCERAEIFLTILWRKRKSFNPSWLPAKHSQQSHVPCAPELLNLLSFIYSSTPHYFLEYPGETRADTDITCIHTYRQQLRLVLNLGRWNCEAAALTPVPLCYSIFFFVVTLFIDWLIFIHKSTIIKSDLYTVIYTAFKKNEINHSQGTSQTNVDISPHWVTL